MSAHSFQHKLQALLKVLKAESLIRPLVLIFGVGSYGDLLQITPLLFSLRQKFPDKSLILIHNDPGAKTLLGENSGLAHCLQLNADDHRLLKKLLRDGPCDLIVECRYAVTYTLPAMSRLNPGEKQFVLHASRLQKPWLPYLDRFPFNNDLLWREAVRRGLNMFRLMAHTSGFGEIDFENLRLPALPPLTEEISGQLPDSYVAVGNSAGWLNIQSNLWTKCLPHSKMNAILDRLKTLEIPTVLLGTANDPGAYRVDLDLRGKTTVLQGAAVIKRANLVLGPEGGMVNLARAVGRKSVVFFGSTPPDFFGFTTNINIPPRVCGGCWWTTKTYLGQCPLLEKVPPCTESIREDSVIDAIEKHFHASPIPA